MDKKNLWKIVGYGIFALFVIVILMTRFLYGSIITVSGTSMVPTFNSGDYVFATVLHENDELNVGDIVILEQDGVYLIKRIYGTPGMTIEPDYVKNIPELTLGDDEYYVLGDNWKVSRDSRSFGPISREEISFKYAGIHWTRLSVVIGLFAPLILFIAQMTIVFIPADDKKKQQAEPDNNESELQENADENADATAVADAENEEEVIKQNADLGEPATQSAECLKDAAEHPAPENETVTQ